MEAKDIIRLPDPRERVQVELREVVQDIQDRPHVFWRLRLTGWHFEFRAQIPFAVVGNVVSHHVDLAPDGTSADAYFNRPLPAARLVGFGWGRTVAWEFPLKISPRKVAKLNRRRLPKGVVDPFVPGR